MLLNRTIVSDVARLHLDFMLCDDSLHRVDLWVPTQRTEQIWIHVQQNSTLEEGRETRKPEKEPDNRRNLRRICKRT